MRKKIIVIGVMVLLICIGLSGCNENEKNLNFNRLDVSLIDVALSKDDYPSYDFWEIGYHKAYQILDKCDKSWGLIEEYHNRYGDNFTTNVYQQLAAFESENIAKDFIDCSKSHKIEVYGHSEINIDTIGDKSFLLAGESTPSWRCNFNTIGCELYFSIGNIVVSLGGWGLETTDFIEAAKIIEHKIKTHQ